jgi:perosamine synthetase
MSGKSFKDIVRFIKALYPGMDTVPLHAPVFLGNEKNYLQDCIDTTFVSYVGKYVIQFERQISQFTGAKHAIAMVNGTTALQVALRLAGVRQGDEVITQALTFVATANAITHAGATPVFVDVERETLGMSPEKLEAWLQKNVRLDPSTNKTTNKITKKVISAIVPMHTLGHPCRIDEICEVAARYSIPVIEDSAESLGSYYKGQHTGSFGLAGILSFNGNKTITCGGGGMILTNDTEYAKRAKHITTTAKIPHPWEFAHDAVGYNYRLTNVNAAIGVAQMENLSKYLQDKRELASMYEEFGQRNNFQFFKEPANAKSNFWLNTIIAEDRNHRDSLLEFTNSNGVVTRPIWQLMSKLKMYEDCQQDDLTNSAWFAGRIVNVPSGVREQFEK